MYVQESCSLQEGIGVSKEATVQCSIYDFVSAYQHKIPNDR